MDRGAWQATVHGVRKSDLTNTNTEEENEFRDLKSLPQAQESPTNY